MVVQINRAITLLSVSKTYHNFTGRMKDLLMNGQSEVLDEYVTLNVALALIENPHSSTGILSLNHDFYQHARFRIVLIFGI